MENRSDILSIKELHQRFCAIASYEEKIQCFDSHWGMVPFSFTAFDAEASWFFLPANTCNLITFFLEESTRKRDFFIKTFVFPPQEFTFSVNPRSTKQRLILNQFILKKIMGASDPAKDQVGSSKATPSTLGKWEKQLDQAQQTIELLRSKLHEKSEQTLPVKFLQVFFKGFMDKTVSEQVISKRKKYVELYLYAQGLLYAQYIGFLQKQIALEKAEKPALDSLFCKKLQVMERIGFINFLKKQYQIENNKDKNRLVREIAFLLSSQPFSASKDENKLVRNFLFENK